jgi:ribose/xylose/arabinose/galactoside ABC-type transport system permease subunit
MFVRAVTQNRAMAGCVGVPTARIDTLAFALGAGIAGLGGLALSQISNVGPDMGQGYIVDAFLVVVLGGVGQRVGQGTGNGNHDSSYAMGNPVLDGMPCLQGKRQCVSGAMAHES